jgi:hypothetical protein
VFSLRENALAALQARLPYAPVGRIREKQYHLKNEMKRYGTRNREN